MKHTFCTHIITSDSHRTKRSENQSTYKIQRTHKRNWCDVGLPPNKRARTTCVSVWLSERQTDGQAASNNFPSSQSVAKTAMRRNYGACALVYNPNFDVRLVDTVYTNGPANSCVLPPRYWTIWGEFNAAYSMGSFDKLRSNVPFQRFCRVRSFPLQTSFSRESSKPIGKSLKHFNAFHCMQLILLLLLLFHRLTYDLTHQ